MPGLLVTGGAGFIGTKVVRLALEQRTDHVTVLDGVRPKLYGAGLNVRDWYRTNQPWWRPHRQATEAKDAAAGRRPDETVARPDRPRAPST
ncbi:hypothetical protein [Propionicimonas sp.]|uniref:hypothetical protein n=1 Tax=Propionicimonas sp. TaxID=1955623 RepID=UPI0039E31CB8